MKEDKFERRQAEMIQKWEREANELARPFIQLKCDILAYTCPAITIGKDGIVTHYPQEVEAQLAQVDDLLNLEMKRLAERWKPLIKGELYR